MSKLQNKVAVITGTGGGQGRAAALLFAREGAIVVGCDIDADSAIEIFTTRIDTIYGASALVLSPKHPLLAQLELFTAQAAQQACGLAG